MTMSNIDKGLIMEIFLDDNVSTMNRLVVATAKVLSEYSETISYVNDALNKEQQLSRPLIESRSSASAPVVRHEYFFEDIVKNYSEEDYNLRFKMSKTTVEALINLLKEFVNHGTPIIPIDKKVHIFLWLLTSDATFKEVGELFGLHKSTVSYIFHEIAALISEQRIQFLNWPSLEEQHVTRIKVNSKYGFPNCIGFIDTCSLKVGSRKTRRSEPETVLLQAVCDETLLFIDVHVGEIGTTWKKKVFRESFICQELKNLVAFDNHILGDCDYKLRMNLITPFTSDEVVTSEEMRFNAVHWKTHSYIRQTFDILRNRFSKLNLIDIKKPEAVNTLIYAACVLHNFVLLQEGSPVKEEVVVINEGVTIDSDVVDTPMEKRQFLCNYINYFHTSSNDSTVNNIL